LGPFDPNSFFSLGKNLVPALGEQEVVYRTAIGRAYYAAHLTARAKVPANSWTGMSKQSDEHWFVRHIMKKTSHPEIADKLETLHQIRKTSDYDMTTGVTKTDFEDAIQLAGDLLSLIDGV
jgi:uncharacterized protein (UPF0332 family)